MTQITAIDGIQEEVLVDLIQLKDCLSLYSKLNLASNETFSPDEMFALFNSLKQQVESIITKHSICF